MDSPCSSRNCRTGTSWHEPRMERRDRHVGGGVPQAGDQVICLLLATGLAFNGLFSPWADRPRDRQARHGELGCVLELHGWAIARVADELWRNRWCVVRRNVGQAERGLAFGANVWVDSPATAANTGRQQSSQKSLSGRGLPDVREGFAGSA